MSRKYHMRRKEKEIARREELNSILANGKYTTIAMCNEDEPYLVTLSYGFDPQDDALYFHCAQEGQKTDFICKNPEVCGTVIEDRGYRMGECEQSYRSVVFRGRMSVVSDLRGKKHGLEVLFNHLENDPSPLKGKYLTDEEALKKVCVLRLSIFRMTGKESR